MQQNNQTYMWFKEKILYKQRKNVNEKKFHDIIRALCKDKYEKDICGMPTSLYNQLKMLEHAGVTKMM